MRTFKEFIVETSIDDFDDKLDKRSPEQKEADYYANKAEKEKGFWRRLGDRISYNWKTKPWERAKTRTPINKDPNDPALKRLHGIIHGPHGNENVYGEPRDSMIDDNGNLRDKPEPPAKSRTDVFGNPTDPAEIFKQRRKKAVDVETEPASKKVKKRTSGKGKGKGIIEMIVGAYIPKRRDMIS